MCAYLREFDRDELTRFVEAIDGALEVPGRIVIIGGAAAILQHGAELATKDIDTFSVAPAGFEKAVREAWRTTDLPINVEYAAVAEPPYAYQDRLERLSAPRLARLEILVPEKHDLALMKICRGQEHDLIALGQMHDHRPFDLDTLVNRYVDEMGQVVADHSILRQKFQAAVARLFGVEVVEDVRDRIERAPIVQQFAATTFVRERSYLGALGLRPETIGNKRFEAAVRQSLGGDLVFPRADTVGVIALEIRNANRTELLGRPDLGIWSSRAEGTDRTLVVTGDPIDALSHAQANPDSHARFCATGADITPAQKRLVVGKIKAMPRGSQVVLAFPGTAAGTSLAMEVQALAPKRKMARHLPPPGGSWSAFVQAQEREWIRAQGFRLERPEPER